MRKPIVMITIIVDNLVTKNQNLIAKLGISVKQL